jgi:predicted alpha/beta-hydrolase family hydrolase
MLGGINAQEPASQFTATQLQAARNAGASGFDVAKFARGYARRRRTRDWSLPPPPPASTWKGQVRVDFIVDPFLASHHLAKYLFAWR